jgi:hypothetical protein
MKVYDATSIRNVAVVGHGGCGKTQLVSAMLFSAGMVNRLGRVDDGTTVTDYDPEEITRKHTLSTSLAYAEWRKTKINLLDTPAWPISSPTHAPRCGSRTPPSSSWTPCPAPPSRPRRPGPQRMSWPCRGSWP